MLLDIVQSASAVSRLKQRLQSQGSGVFGFYNASQDGVHYVVAMERSTIIGLLGFMEQGVYDPDYIELVFCEVHRDHRRQGVASRLVEEFMALVAARAMPATVTPYEEDGVAGLQPLLQRHARERGIYLHEQGLAKDIADNPDRW